MNTQFGVIACSLLSTISLQLIDWVAKVLAEGFHGVTDSSSTRGERATATAVAISRRAYRLRVGVPMICARCLDHKPCTAASARVSTASGAGGFSMARVMVDSPQAGHIHHLVEMTENATDWQRAGTRMLDVQSTRRHAFHGC
jgi:hypothetical protein